MYGHAPAEIFNAFQSELRALRRDLHAHPELGFHESRACARVADMLEAMGIEVHRNIGQTGLVGEQRVERHLPPSMGAEDFSYMLQHRPGAYFRLGQGGAQSGCLLHNPNYDFNDDVIPVGARLFASIVERSMPL